MTFENKLPIRTALIGNIICTFLAFSSIAMLIFVGYCIILSGHKIKNPIMDTYCDDSYTHYAKVVKITNVPNTKLIEVQLYLRGKYVIKTMSNDVSLHIGEYIPTYTPCAFPQNGTIYLQRQYQQHNVMFYQVLAHYLIMLIPLLIISTFCSIVFATCYVFAIIDYYAFE